jgi:hypothetical protein
LCDIREPIETNRDPGKNLLKYPDFDFKSPDYTEVLRIRAEKLADIRANPKCIPALKKHYQNNIAQFINDWGMTFDPRNPEIGLPSTIPFVLFDRQREWIDWLIERWKSREDGLTDKSREMGLSWLSISVACSICIFYKGIVIGFGSRKEEYVDKLGDPKSLFWKARQFINLLPVEFRPEGWNENKDALYMRIINPENGSSIVGEAGDNIGRGARASIYFKDESAFLQNQESIDAALSMTSNCKIDISTPNGNANSFAQRRHSGKVPVFSFHWRDDPRKDDEWYKRKEATLDPVIMAQEVDIDYNASATDVWISGSLIEEAQGIGPADILPVGGWRVGVDAAHMGDDVSVAHFRKGRLNLPQKEWRKLDGPQLAANIIEECDSLHDNIEAIIIELDGPGVSCYDTLKNNDKYKDVTFGVHTGARLSDGKNYNIRAKLWRNAKEYLQAPPVSIARSPELKAQLSSLKYKYKDGLLLMQDKKQYKKEYGRSPDNADAFILTFADMVIKIIKAIKNLPTQANKQNPLKWGSRANRRR